MRKKLAVTLTAVTLMFGALAPAPALAANCLYNGTEYSPGASVDGKTCQPDGHWF